MSTGRPTTEEDWEDGEAGQEEGGAAEVDGLGGVGTVIVGVQVSATGAVDAAVAVGRAEWDLARGRAAAAAVGVPIERVTTGRVVGEFA
jgi:hypothetical protein